MYDSHVQNLKLIPLCVRWSLRAKEIKTSVVFWMPFCFVLFWNNVLVACLRWSWTHSNPPALASQVLEFQTGTTMPTLDALLYGCAKPQKHSSLPRGTPSNNTWRLLNRREWAKITEQHLPFSPGAMGAKTVVRTVVVFAQWEGVWLDSENPGHRVASSTTLTWIFSQTYSEE